MKCPRVIHSLLSINRSGQNFYWFYKIQLKYIKERVNNVGMVILFIAIFLWVSKWMKRWNKWLSLGSRECYGNKQWPNSCHDLWLNLEIPKTFLRTKLMSLSPESKLQNTNNKEIYFDHALGNKNRPMDLVSSMFISNRLQRMQNLSTIYKCKLRESLAVWA